MPSLVSGGLDHRKKDILYHESPSNVLWKKVLEDVRQDPEGFWDDGGWLTLLKGDEEDGDEGEGEGEGEEWEEAPDEAMAPADGAAGGGGGGGGGGGDSKEGKSDSKAAAAGKAPAKGKGKKKKGGDSDSDEDYAPESASESESSSESDESDPGVRAPSAAAAQRALKRFDLTVVCPVPCAAGLMMRALCTVQSDDDDADSDASDDGSESEGEDWDEHERKAAKADQQKAAQEIVDSRREAERGPKGAPPKKKAKT
jgi:hypothetical protein